MDQDGVKDNKLLSCLLTELVIIIKELISPDFKTVGFLSYKQVFAVANVS